MRSFTKSMNQSIKQYFIKTFSCTKWLLFLFCLHGFRACTLTRNILKNKVYKHLLSNCLDKVWATLQSNLWTALGKKKNTNSTARQGFVKQNLLKVTWSLGCTHARPTADFPGCTGQNKERKNPQTGEESWVKQQAFRINLKGPFISLLWITHASLRKEKWQ